MITFRCGRKRQCDNEKRLIFQDLSMFLKYVPDSDRVRVPSETSARTVIKTRREMQPAVWDTARALQKEAARVAGVLDPAGLSG